MVAITRKVSDKFGAGLFYLLYVHEIGPRIFPGSRQYAFEIATKDLKTYGVKCMGVVPILPAISFEVKEDY